MTVEAWVTSDANRTAYLVSDGTSSTTGYHLWLASNGAPVFTVRMTGGTVQVQGAPLSLLAWHHLAATVDATAVTLYADGVAVATSPALGTPRAATTTLYLGRYSGGSRNLRGALDEVALYGAALDPATVAAHYALGADTRPPATAACRPRRRRSRAPPSASFAFAATKPASTFECKLDTVGVDGVHVARDVPERRRRAAHASASARATATASSSRRRPRARGRSTPSRPTRARWRSCRRRSSRRRPSPSPPPTPARSSSAASTAARGRRARARCASPAPHQLAVRGVDAAGNADQTPSTVAIPAARAAAATAALTGPTAAFGLWSDGTGPTACNLDDGQWAPCGATLQTGALPPGPTPSPSARACRAVRSRPSTTTWTVALPAPRLVGVQFPVLVYLPPARKIGKRFPASRLPAVRFSLNVGATVRLSLDRTTGARAHRHLATWTITATAGRERRARPARDLPQARQRPLPPDRRRRRAGGRVADAHASASRSSTRRARRAAGAGRREGPPREAQHRGAVGHTTGAATRAYTYMNIRVTARDSAPGR